MKIIEAHNVVFGFNGNKSAITTDSIEGLYINPADGWLRIETVQVPQLPKED